MPHQQQDPRFLPVQGGRGVGILLMVVVAAVVLWLTARAWRTVTPAATQLAHPARRPPLSDHGQTEAAQALRSGELPDLDEMRRRTDGHQDEVQEALAGTE